MGYFERRSSEGETIVLIERKEIEMIFVRAGKPLSKPDPDLAKSINNLLEQERKEAELCLKCVNDNRGLYNPICQHCDDFCNFKEKES